MTVTTNYDDPATVAVVYHPDDRARPYDRCWTWEAGQTYALSGYLVVAVAPDGHLSVSDAQSLYDAERARFMDCYGRTAPFEEP